MTTRAGRGPVEFQSQLFNNKQWHWTCRLAITVTTGRLLCEEEPVQLLGDDTLGSMSRADLFPWI